MASIIFNFFKRTVIVPSVFCVLFIVVITFANSMILNPTSGNENQKSEFDYSSFSTKQYNSFDELESDDFAGTISSADIGVDTTAVLYNVVDMNNISIEELSSEPWNGGSMLITGKNIASQLKPFHNAQIGDEIVFDAYSNSKYTFKVKKIDYGVKENNLKKYMKQGALIICLPYNDFSNLSNAYLYTVYVAD